jgi:hypothetical protein
MQLDLKIILSEKQKIIMNTFFGLSSKFVSSICFMFLLLNRIDDVDDRQREK